MRKTKRIPLSPTLRRFKFLFDMLKRTTDDYLVLVDLQEHLTIVSPNLVREFDLPGETIPDGDQIFGTLVHPEERGQFQALLRSAASGQPRDDYNMEGRVKTRKGDYAWLRFRARVGNDREGRPSIMVATIRRMAQRNQADEVTGLLNKYQFEHGVKSALAEYHATSEGGAIMIFGLDNFKMVNEAYNRVTGDMVLKNVAGIISDLLPPMLTLYKLDGDQFGLILPSGDEEQANKVFEGIQRALVLPQDIDGHEYLCTISAGTVFYPMGGKDYLVLYKHAEAALDIAKRDGKNRNCIFSKEQYNRWVRSISMRDDIFDSVENGCTGFSLFFQPQVDARTRHLLGAEALLRWRNPKGKMVAPMEFIPILEETKLIIPVGKWIFEQAVKVCRRWRAFVPEFHISINMSYEQVKDLSFKDFANKCLQDYDLPADAIVLELTESKIVADWNFVNQQFDAFRQAGIRIAMDDFGKGYSSLSLLKNLSCDIVKIDRAFVNKILDTDFDRQLVEYTIKLCHSVDLDICVEGVEQKAQYDLLSRTCHADTIQGYLFGRPECEADFEQKYVRGVGESQMPIQKVVKY